MISSFYSYLSRKLFLITLIILSVSYGHAQEFQKTPWIKTDHSDQAWFKAVNEENPNYNEIKLQYDQYFAEHPLEKSVQRNMVRRWLSVYENYKDGEGNVRIAQPTPTDFAKVRTAEKIAKEKFAKTSATKMVSSPNSMWNDSVGTWRMIGPYHSRFVAGVYAMFGGFNDRVYINPHNPDNMFAGQSYGGLWVSQDGGATWKLTDSEFPNGQNGYANRDIYYGAIEAHPLNSSRIVAATEAGLLVSTNGGDAWTLDPVLNHLNMPGERSYYVSQKINDQNTMLCTYGRKLYRTTDGGANWTVVFDNSSGGANYSQGQHNTIGVYQRQYNFFGLQYHPTDPDVVFFGARNSANQACVYRSANGGASFSLISNTGKTNRVKLMLSLADDLHFFVADFFTSVSSPNPTEGIIKYDTAGIQVQFIAHQGGQGALLDDIVVSNTDPDVWSYGGYASGEVWITNDQGATWQTNNPGYTNFSNYVHPDVRAISIVGDTILIGSDGGLHISHDAGVTFEAAGDWISGIDQWGFSSAFKGEILASGDDHGPTEIRTADKDRSWVGIGGADSGEVEINRCNTDYMYGRDIYSRFLARRTSDSTYVRQANSLIDAKYEYLAQDPDEYFKFYPIKNNQLFVSEDNMQTSELLFTFGQNLTKVVVPLQDNQVLYVLENNTIVHKSTDGGTSWSVITPPLGVTNNRTNITDIAVDETGMNVWLSYGQTQTNCKAVHSSDGASTWNNITGSSLPSFAAGDITYQRGTNGMVYLATNGGGVWYKDLVMSDWAILGAGLPMMGYVRTIYTTPDMGKFRMGTARGSFEHDLAAESAVIAHFSAPSRTGSTCQYDTVQFFDYSSYRDYGSMSFLWTFEGGNPATSSEMNPKIVYSEAGVFDVSLTVDDGNGNVNTKTMTDFMNIYTKDCSVTTIAGFTTKNVDNNSYVATPAMDLEGSEAFTWTAWVKGEGTQRDYAGILSHENFGGNIHLNVRSSNVDSTEIGYHHPNGQWWWSSGLYLVPGKWTHLAMVVDLTGVTIYKDGKSSKHSVTLGNPDFTGQFVIGSMIGRLGDRCFKGKIDEVAIYKRALTSDEIRKMRHLTKQNPNYPAQYDADLVGYYQFNTDGSTVYDVSGNSKNGNSFGSIVKVQSTGPFGGGTSDIIDVTAPGNYTFTESGMEIDFAAGIVPQGKIVVSHIENAPSDPPVDKLHEDGYYIVNNYGVNSAFTTPNSVAFTKTGTISSEVAATDVNFKVHKRGSNADSNTYDVVANASEIQLVAGAAGQVDIIDASSITSFSQFVITRASYPSGLAMIMMTDPASSNIAVEGGTSMSFFLKGDNQGLGMPVATDQELNALGQPVEGALIYSSAHKAILLFSGDTWNILDAEPLLELVSVGTGGTSKMTMSGSANADPSSIVSFQSPGFIVPVSLTQAELVAIDFPVEGMLVYNETETALQIFNGSKWQSMNTITTTIPVSTSIALVLEGIHNGLAKAPNAIWQDNDKTGAIMLPVVNVADINTPREGLLVFDSRMNRILFYDGNFWSRLK